MKTKAEHSLPGRHEHVAPRLARSYASARGTVLLMVVGVLALMAIIAVVYATLGRAERSSATALTGAVKDERVSTGVADYIANVLGDSTFSVYPEPTLKDGVPQDEWIIESRLRQSDYPGVDQRAVSLKTNATVNDNGLHLFTPTGSFSPISPRFWVPDAAGPNAQPRTWHAPFLASSEPTYIERPRWTSGTNGKTLAVGFESRNSTDPHRLIRDWKAISNISPCGHFVNLVNLRNNFDAPSGFVNNGMSSRLVLYGDSSSSSFSGVAQVVNPNFGPDDPTNVIKWDGRRAILNRPADWSTNQLYTFRPMVDNQYQPGDAEYLFNSFADADGDGYADSRLTELVSFKQDPNNPLALFVEQAIPGFGGFAGATGSGQRRYFVAVRIVDSSSKINVNTATEFHSEPTAMYPAGVTPADIDLRRLLTLFDQQQFLVQYRTTNGQEIDFKTKLPYALLTQPSSDQFASYYSDYRTELNNNTTNIGFECGLAAYGAIRDWINNGRLRLEDNARSYSLSKHNNVLTVALPLTAAQRAEMYDRSVTPGRSRYESIVERSTQAAFTLADELELITYNGLNDDKNTSRLEQVVGGRLLNADTLSPLRDNRSLLLERHGRDIPYDTTVEPLRTDSERAKIQYLMDPRRHLTTVSGARPLIDSSTSEGLKLKLDVTPLMSRIRNGEYFGRPPTPQDTDPARGNLTVQELLANTLLRDDAIRVVFSRYVDALAPYADKPASWLAPADPSEYCLAYGGSTEVAMRIAAHMVLNWADSYDHDLILNPRVLATRRAIQDDDHIPTAMTLTLTERAVDESRSINSTVGDHYPWSTLAHKNKDKHLETPNTRNIQVSDAGMGGNVASDPNNPTLAGPVNSNTVERVNVYGIEAQPFLTEVAYHSILVDAAAARGGDEDGDALSAGNLPGQPPVNEFITVLADRDVDNADFVCEILTFTLHNPFDSRVYLYRATGVNTSVSKPRFYLEYANRFYALAEQDPTAQGGGGFGIKTSKDVFMEPGETRVFYAINPGRVRDVAERIDNLKGGTSTYTPDSFRSWLRHQFGSNINDDPIVQVDPRTFEPIGYTVASSLSVSTGQVDLQSGSQTAAGAPQTLAEQVAVDLLGTEDVSTYYNAGGGRQLPSNGTGAGRLGFGQASDGASRGVAMLWRVMRVGDDLNLNESYNSQTISNDIINDLLADRLRDPVVNANDFRIQKLIDELYSFDHNRAIGTGIGSAPSWNLRGPDRADCATAATESNFGVVVHAYAKFCRPYDQSLDENTPWRGYLPAWCLESKVDRDRVTTPWHSEYSPSSNVGVSSWSMNWSWFDEDEYKNFQGNSHDICTFFDATTTQTLDVVADKAMHSRYNSGVAIRQQALKASGRTNEPARVYSQVAPVYISTPLVGRGLNEVRTVLNPGLYSRSGDFLYPMVVGPEYVPGRMQSGSTLYSGSVNDRLAQLETQWLTLSEALAMGCGYYSPPNVLAGVQGSVPLYHNFSNDTRSSTTTDHAIVPKAERGGLVIDAWAPFAKLGPPRVYTPLRSGVPLAMGIMDQFMAAPAVASTDGWAEENGRAYGGLREKVPGVININTAPPSVLRTVPMLSPENWATQNVDRRRDAASWVQPGPDVAVAANEIGRCCVSARLNTQALYYCAVMRRQECESVRGGAVFQPRLVCDAGEFCGPSPNIDAAGGFVIRAPEERLLESDGNAGANQIPSPQASGLLGYKNFISSSNTVDVQGKWNDSLSGIFNPRSTMFAWDIAPTLVAYRDRTVVPNRPVSDQLLSSTFSKFIPEDVNNPTARLPVNMINNRFGVYGSREQGGFKTLGEVLMANQYESNLTPIMLTAPSGQARFLPAGPKTLPAPNAADPPLPQSVQRFGNSPFGQVLDPIVTGVATTARAIGIDSETAGIAITPQLPTSGTVVSSTQPVLSANILPAKLAVANALANTTSVRSDVFTAHFLIHGYTRADVENLEYDQPMIPSFAKRFVMVVDRSNVASPGEKPEVLLLKEVPVE